MSNVPYCEVLRGRSKVDLFFSTEELVPLIQFDDNPQASSDAVQYSIVDGLASLRHKFGHPDAAMSHQD